MQSTCLTECFISIKEDYFIFFNEKLEIDCISPRDVNVVVAHGHAQMANAPRADATGSHENWSEARNE